MDETIVLIKNGVKENTLSSLFNNLTFKFLAKEPNFNEPWLVYVENLEYNAPKYTSDLLYKPICKFLP